MYTHHIRSILGSLALAVPFAMACGNAQVNSSANVIDRTTHALSLGSLLEVNGQFGSGCTNRSGSWSVGVGGFMALSNPALTVTANDTSCTLSVSSLQVGTTLTSSLFVPPSTVQLGASYMSSAVSFAALPGSPTEFYCNLRIQPDLSFSSDFTINLLYSDDPNVASGSAIATYTTPPTSASATAGSVPAPDYSLDLSGVSIQVNQAKLEQSASGSVVLTAMSVAGQQYVVSTTDLGAAPAFAEVDAAYLAGTPQSFTGLNPSIPISDFSLAMADLSSDVIRTLIVANTANAVTSYQVFRITFSAQ